MFVNPGRDVGGAEQSLLLLLDGLRARGVDVTVALFGDGALSRCLESRGVRTAVIPVSRVVRRATRYESLRGPVRVTRLGVLSLAVVFRLAALARRLGAAVVHTNGLKAHVVGGLAGRLVGRRVVWHVRDFPPPGMAGQLLRSSARWLPSLILTPSAAVAAAVVGGDRRRPAVAVPNPVDLSRFRPGLRRNATRQELGVGTDAPLVGQVAHLTPWKGHELFLRIAHRVGSQLPDARFVVVGGPIYETDGHAGYVEALARQAGELGLAERVTFLGAREDIPQILAALDVLVHCPIAPEPFGRVLAEAMATGTPIVAADCGGIAEVVEDRRTACLVPPGDAGAFAAAVLKLLQDGALRRQMAVAGRRRAERLFAPSAHVEAVFRAYQSIVGTAP